MYKITVVGYGSIGKRHASNLKELGHEVSVVDVSEESLQQSEQDGYQTYCSVHEAVESKPDIAVICTPTVYHIAYAMSFAIEGIHVFVEKPISYSTEGVSDLINICKEKNTKLMCGCNLRFLQSVKLLKMLLNNGSIGRPLTSDYTFGYELRKWHPGTDYTKSYSAGLHGGILLDDIHAIDLFEHLFGKPVDVKGYLINTGILNIKNEDIAEYILKTDNGFTGRIHSDYYSIEYTRNMRILGSQGILEWNMELTDNNEFNSAVYIKTPAINEWRVFRNIIEPVNNMYVNEMQYFINCIENNTEPYSNGRTALETAMKLKKDCTENV